MKLAAKQAVVSVYKKLHLRKNEWSRIDVSRIKRMASSNPRINRIHFLFNLFVKAKLY